MSSSEGFCPKKANRTSSPVLQSNLTSSYITQTGPNVLAQTESKREVCHEVLRVMGEVKRSRGAINNIFCSLAYIYSILDAASKTECQTFLQARLFQISSGLLHTRVMNPQQLNNNWVNGSDCLLWVYLWMWVEFSCWSASVRLHEESLGCLLTV